MDLWLARAHRVAGFRRLGWARCPPPYLEAAVPLPGAFEGCVTAIKPAMRNILCFRHLTLYFSIHAHLIILIFSSRLIMIALSLLSLLLASTALAAPTRRYNAFQGACSVPASAVAIPQAPQFNLPQLPPNLVQMGVGVQNYTCNSKGTFE